MPTGPGRVKTAVKPRGHLINDRKTEIIIGLLVAALGVVLLWDASTGRGKDFPWPVGGFMPW